MAKAPITKRTVDAAKPAVAEYVVWDHGGKETVKGFGLKVTPAGSKIYLYQYRLARPGAADGGFMDSGGVDWSRQVIYTAPS